VTPMHSLDIQPPALVSSPRGLYALEVTAKTVARIAESKAEIPPGTPINIAFLGSENHAQRIHAARIVRQYGFEPVPIISARRLLSERELDNFLGYLIGEVAPTRFMLVGGDPMTPAGPYVNSLGLLESGILQRHAIRHVGIVAHPEGHPKIDADTLWRALRWKLAFLKEAGCSVEITTQFGLDADAIVRWITRLRGEEISTPVRIGIPGPTNAGRLLRYAEQFGVIRSDGLLRKYGLSLTNLLQRVTSDRFVERLALGLNGRDFGTLLYHLYPFGGIADGVRWMGRFLRDQNLVAVPHSYIK
jgi:methylenetetrahydrofolate reductase (NADPH)